MLKGIPDDPELLSAIPADTAKVLVTLMAQLSEHSYRRGVSQGAEAANSGYVDVQSIDKWRLYEPIDRSPAIDASGFSRSAEERISGAISSLRGLGLKC